MLTVAAEYAHNIARKEHVGQLPPNCLLVPNKFIRQFLTSFATNRPQNVTSGGTNQKKSDCFACSIVFYPTLKTVAPPVIAMVS